MDIFWLVVKYAMKEVDPAKYGIDLATRKLLLQRGISHSEVFNGRSVELIQQQLCEIFDERNE